eukprot:g44359.t1
MQIIVQTTEHTNISHNKEHSKTLITEAWLCLNAILDLLDATIATTHCACGWETSRQSEHLFCRAEQSWFVWGVCLYFCGFDHLKNSKMTLKDPAYDSFAVQRFVQLTMQELSAVTGFEFGTIKEVSLAIDNDHIDGAIRTHRIATPLRIPMMSRIDLFWFWHFTSLQQTIQQELAREEAGRESRKTSRALVEISRESSRGLIKVEEQVKYHLCCESSYV